LRIRHAESEPGEEHCRDAEPEAADPDPPDEVADRRDDEDEQQRVVAEEAPRRSRSA